MNKILTGDSLEVLKTLESDSVDLIATDPPYGIGFMGKEWDTFKPDVLAKGVERSSRKSTAVDPENPNVRERGSAAMESARYDHSPAGARKFREWLYDHSVEWLRVLKPGAFAFVCMGARQDSVAAAITAMTEAGFKTDFTSLFWTYASGFPKAMNIGKMVDKRNGKDFNPELKTYLAEARERSGKTLKEINVALGYSDKGGNFASDMFSFKKDNRYLYPTVAQWQTLKTLLNLDDRFDELIEREEAKREVIGKHPAPAKEIYQGGQLSKDLDITIAKTDAAKALDGSYGGFQPKPAVEVIIVAMKPLSEKTYVDQALKNGKGITWLDDCRVPTQPRSTGTKKDDVSAGSGHSLTGSDGLRQEEYDRKIAAGEIAGRFPANLLVSDDVLNDGRVTRSGFKDPKKVYSGEADIYGEYGSSASGSHNDSGSYSRYFDLDAWAETLPFLVVPKASKREKNAGLSDREGVTVGDGPPVAIDNAFQRGKTERKNSHPTVKPLKLMSYLITLGSRPGDVVLDPFLGSGTTAIAAKQLGRQYIGIEREQEYVEIAEARIAAVPETLFTARKEKVKEILV